MLLRKNAKNNFKHLIVKKKKKKIGKRMKKQLVLELYRNLMEHLKMHISECLYINSLEAKGQKELAEMSRCERK